MRSLLNSTNRSPTPGRFAFPRRKVKCYLRESPKGKRGNGNAQTNQLLTGATGDAWVIDHSVQALSEDELLERYHELVDRRFTRPLHLAESFELERIEARLNLQDEDEIDRTASLHAEWKRERDELVTSIESLLARFKATV
jgi:hypothetical protein